MENSLSLRSLEATGRPPGTGRSTSWSRSPFASRRAEREQATVERSAGNEREPEAEPEFSSSFAQATRWQRAGEQATQAPQPSSARAHGPNPAEGQAGSQAAQELSSQPSVVAKAKMRSEHEGASGETTEASVGNPTHIELLFASLLGADAAPGQMLATTPPAHAVSGGMSAAGQALGAGHNPTARTAGGQGAPQAAAPTTTAIAAHGSLGTTAPTGTHEQPGQPSSKPGATAPLANVGSSSTPSPATVQDAPQDQVQPQTPFTTELAALQLDALESQASAPAPIETPGSQATPLEQASLAEAALANRHPESGELASLHTAGERVDPAFSKRSEASRTAAPSSPATSNHTFSEGETRARDILRQVQLQFSPAGRQAVIQLQPAELGRMAFRLTVRGGKIDTEVRVERDTTLKDLQHALPELRAMLDREGMAGGNLSLTLGFDQPGGGAFQADTQASERDHAQAQPPAQSAPMLAPAPVPRALAAALAAGLSIDTLA